MKAERWRQIRDLFDSVCDLPAAERGEQLQKVAEEDPELASESATSSWNRYVPGFCVA